MAEIDQPQHIREQQLAELLREAAKSARRRSHLLLHADQEDQVQRLLIALHPDSYIRPHIHSEQWEMLLLLRGRLDVLVLSADAEIAQRVPMTIAEPIVQIPRATWHSGVALESETLVLEVKPGPYRPNEFAEWAPHEGETAAARFVSWAASARDGNKW
jgi:cupin fold WbuC family metalloprotein